MVMLMNPNASATTGPMSVAFYLRVSADRQAQKEDGSLDTQLDRVKVLLPSFVDYVVGHSAEKGEGRLEVALFQAPVGLAPDLSLHLNARGRGCAGAYQMVDLKGFEPSTS